VARVMLAGRYSMKSATPNGYALWSGGPPAHQYATGQGYQVLEQTDAGKIFDGVEILDGDWRILLPLWQEISRQYAAMPKLPGAVHCFQRWIGGVFKAVERPTLEARAAAAGQFADLSFAFHALAAPGKSTDDDKNKARGVGVVTAGDLTEIGTFSNQSAADVALRQHNENVEASWAGRPANTTEPEENEDPTNGNELLGKYEGQIRNAHPSARAEIEGSMRANVKVLSGKNSWNEVRDTLVARGKPKQMVEKPASVQHGFGRMVMSDQAPDAVQRAAASVPDGKARLQGQSYADYATRAKRSINAGAGDFGSARQLLSTEVFDRNVESQAEAALQTGFEGRLQGETVPDTGTAHDAYKPTGTG